MRQIDIKIPKGWNQCTTEQLETVMTLYLLRQARQDRYHPFDPLQWKTECFFALAGLEVVGIEEGNAPTPAPPPEGAGNPAGMSPPDAVGASGDTAGTVPPVSEAVPPPVTYLVRFRRQRGFLSHLSSLISHLKSLFTLHSSLFTEKYAPFPLEDWQLLSFIEQHLGWLDHFDQLLIFPYKRLGYDWRAWHWRVTYLPRLPIPLPYPSPEPVTGPDTLMQDFSWQEYRFAQQYLESYTMQQNAMLRTARLAERARTAEERQSLARQLRSQQERLQQVRTDWLMAMFRTKHPVGQLRRMGDAQFQLVLIYWQSIMHRLASKYPRCFKSAPTGRQPKKNQTPLDLYVRSIATLEKYLGQSEEEINRKMFYANLQHLDDMAREAEEMERISRKNKGKGRK